jgi:hypothetical protein
MLERPRNTNLEQFLIFGSNDNVEENPRFLSFLVSDFQSKSIIDKLETHLS